MLLAGTTRTRRIQDFGDTESDIYIVMCGTGYTYL